MILRNHLNFFIAANPNLNCHEKINLRAIAKQREVRIATIGAAPRIGKATLTSVEQFNKSAIQISKAGMTFKEVGERLLNASKLLKEINKPVLKQIGSMYHN